jgi:hypothetical protein
MLHHISVAVNNPQHVANVLAEIFQGSAIPFPPHPGSYMTLAADKFGTGIELYPLGTELVPDVQEGQAGFQVKAQSATNYSPFHVAISVPSNLEEIERIGTREGWRVFPCSRDGLFDVVEFWVENRLMLELLTPTMAAGYMECLNPEHLPALIEQFTMVPARVE